MRRPFLGLTAACAIVLFASTDRASAQVPGVGADPFSFYYGYYLPHQAAIAAQPTPLDTINQVNAQRAIAARTDRSSLYDPISPYGDEEADPNQPFSFRRGGERRAKVQGFTTGAGSASGVRGDGPRMYYSRTAQYFPTLRTGRGPNQNLGVHRGGRGGGGMPSMGMGMPGPR